MQKEGNTDANSDADSVPEPLTYREPFAFSKSDEQSHGISIKEPVGKPVREP